MVEMYLADKCGNIMLSSSHKSVKDLSSEL